MLTDYSNDGHKTAHMIWWHKTLRKVCILCL
jgi:hypothetical protein